MNRPSLNDILHEIRNWKMEVNSWRNDGWTRAHYMIMLNKIKEEIPNTNFGDGLNWDLRHNGGTLSRKMLEGHRKYQKQKKLKEKKITMPT